MISKFFQWKSKMTTFWTRSPSVSCNSTVLFHFRTDVDFLCKARGNLWLKGPCTKPFSLGGMRFWVYIFCSKPLEICDKIFTGQPKWPRFELVRPQWAVNQPSFFNLGQTFPQNFSKSQISAVFAQQIKTFFIHFRAKSATLGAREIGNFFSV